MTLAMLHRDADAVLVTTTIGSQKDQDAVLAALRERGITPGRINPGVITLSFDPREVTQKQAVEAVRTALRAARIDTKLARKF